MPVGENSRNGFLLPQRYIRRPGITAAQKAGAKQQLMAIQRYQDFNTVENKFLFISLKFYISIVIDMKGVVEGNIGQKSKNSFSY
jgi:hypothetical protein